VSSNVAAPAASNGDNGNHQWHCSRCVRVWTLNERQGICQWCGKLAVCQSSQTKPRHIKSRSNRRQKQPHGNGNGYDHLEGQWLTYYKIASRFAHKAKAEDTEDLLHDIIITLADVEHNNGHKPFTEAAMYRIASRTVADYWRSYYKASRGLDRGSCSQKQRRKCREDNLYTECPRAIRFESLDKPIIDSEGHTTELGELIADDKAIDLGAWIDARTFLLGFPQRLLMIAVIAVWCCWCSYV
jgi:DNA-directed RNA polymerase specialized sigma24 family protein